MEGLCLLGHSVCLKGLGKLLGIGSGRLMKMRTAARTSQTCPLDGRFREARPAHRAPNRQQSHKRELIHDFLTELYLKQSEPTPEVNADTGGRKQTSKALMFRKRKGKRPRRLIKRDGDIDEATVKGMRLLPASSYSDWLRLFESRHPDCKVSLKLFTRASQLTVMITFFEFIGQMLCLKSNNWVMNPKKDCPFKI